MIIPNTGDLPGAWGTSAINVNMQALDGILGGVQTIALAGATTFTLTGPAASITPSAGPNQQSNAVIAFSGTLAGNNVVQFTVPGLYTIDNQCISTTFYIQLKPSSGTGSFIGLPPSETTDIMFDGTNVKFRGLGRVGSALDMHNVTTYPVWMTACSTLPYLIKDGSTYSTAAYPALAAFLGSTYGGNGVTTFGVPDERGRMRISVDTQAGTTFANRVTAAGSGVNGTTLGAAGGNEFMQSHSHPNSLNDPGHFHISPASGSPGASNNASVSGAGGVGIQSDTRTTGITITNAAAGSGSSQNMPPVIVDFLALVKT